MRYGMTLEEQKNLLAKAAEARKNSYSPYSEFRVGAALLAADGTVYTGCNVENASFGATICAERTAMLKAVSEGKRSFTAIAVAGGKTGREPDRSCAPCGMCRQFLSEFVDGSFLVITGNPDTGFDVRTFAEYLPYGFTNLEE